MSAWQPIETAPAGEQILLFFPDVFVSSYVKPWHNRMWRVGNPRDFPNRKPTHWQPLTEPSPT